MRKAVQLPCKIGCLSPYGHLMTDFMMPIVCLETTAKKFANSNSQSIFNDKQD